MSTTGPEPTPRNQLAKMGYKGVDDLTDKQVQRYIVAEERWKERELAKRSQTVLKTDLDIKSVSYTMTASDQTQEAWNTLVNSLKNLLPADPEVNRTPNPESAAKRLSGEECKAIRSWRRKRLHARLDKAMNVLLDKKVRTWLTELTIGQ